MDKVGTQTNSPKNKKVDDAQDLTTDDIDYICQEKEEEDSPALKIAWMYQYDDLRTTLKRVKKD